MIAPFMNHQAQSVALRGVCNVFLPPLQHPKYSLVTRLEALETLGISRENLTTLPSVQVRPGRCVASDIFVIAAKLRCRPLA